MRVVISALTHRLTLFGYVLGALVLLCSAAYLAHLPREQAQTLLAVFAVSAVVLASAVFVMRRLEKLNAEQLRDMAKDAARDAALFEQVARNLAAEQISVGASKLRPEVDGLYEGFRFSIVTAEGADHGGQFALIWFSGNAAEKWPMPLPERAAALRASPPALRDAWTQLLALGHLLPEVGRLVPGKLAFAPKSERGRVDRVPQDQAIYARCFVALTVLARELDRGSQRV